MIFLKGDNMSLIELKDIGKIYVSENSVAVGIRGVNAKMDVGEFIAVTGASGSGKTTLLNVLSGMDTYEEGEMLVCGEPTSHYIQSDWEEYREKYISFIFQDYNILESFTVLQNVELALTHISSKKERRKRAELLLEKVGLTKHKNHKGSKLSGGQKQRTVIARALAKDSPIILADEPTGNLDSRSAKEIIDLLKEISADKLVVVVTHSFDEVKDVATREIRIFDGAVERDTVLADAEKKDPKSLIAAAEGTSKKKKLSFIRDGVELGAHRFFAKPKLAVFMSIIMTVAILATFFFTALIIGDPNLLAKDHVFTPLDGRVAITHIDGSPITEEEISKLAERLGAKSYLSFDGALDTFVRIRKPDSDYGYMSLKYTYGTDGCKPTVGRLPGEGEVYLKLPIKMRPHFGSDTLLIDTIRSDSGQKYKVSGVEYFYDNGKYAEMVIRTEDFAEMSVSGYFNNRQGDITVRYSVMYENGELIEQQDSRILINNELKGNEVLLVGKYSDEEILSVSNFSIDIYDYSFMQGRMSYDFDGEYNEAKSDALFKEYQKGEKEEYFYYNIWGVHISPELASDIIENSVSKLYPQASLFFENDSEAKQACAGLKDEGYLALTTDVYYFDIEQRILSIIEAIFLIAIWLVAIIFLCFFLSLCMSKNVDTLRKDVGILRSMGIKNNAIRVSMYSIMALSAIPALIFFAVVAFAVYTSPTLNPMVPFIHAPHYALIVLGMFIIVMRLAGKNNKRIFKQSVRKTLRGGNEE